MDLTFSAHALNRCMERDISLQQVADALFAGEMRSDGTRRVLTHGRLRVIAVIQNNTCRVLTAFRLPNENPKRALQKRKTFLRRLRREDKATTGIWW